MSHYIVDHPLDCSFSRHGPYSSSAYRRMRTPKSQEHREKIREALLRHERSVSHNKNIRVSIQNSPNRIKSSDTIRDRDSRRQLLLNTHPVCHVCHKTPDQMRKLYIDVIDDTDRLICNSCSTRRRNLQRGPGWKKSRQAKSGEGLEPKLRFWSQSVLRRDDYTCQKCQTRVKDQLVAHHIIHRTNDDSSHNFDIDNGLTLCRACHIKEHQEVTRAAHRGTRERYRDLKEIND